MGLISDASLLVAHPKEVANVMITKPDGDTMVMLGGTMYDTDLLADFLEGSAPGLYEAWLGGPDHNERKWVLVQCQEPCVKELMHPFVLSDMDTGKRVTDLMDTLTPPRTEREFAQVGFTAKRSLYLEDRDGKFVYHYKHTLWNRLKRRFSEEL